MKWGCWHWLAWLASLLAHICSLWGLGLALGIALGLQIDHQPGYHALQVAGMVGMHMAEVERLSDVDLAALLLVSGVGGNGFQHLAVFSPPGITG